MLTPSTPQLRALGILSEPSHVSRRTSGISRMRVFLVQTAKGLLSSSGGYKANICLLRHLASRGHSVRQLCYSYPGEVEEYINKVTEDGGIAMRLSTTLLHLDAETGTSGFDVKVEEIVMEDGIEIVSLESDSFDAAFGGKEKKHSALAKETKDYIENGEPSLRLRGFVSFLQEQVERFSPTHILSNDGLSMQATSTTSMPSIETRRVGIIHTAEQLPFGPFTGGIPGATSSPSEDKLLRELDGIWSVSNAIKQYAFTHGKLQTSFFVHHPWTYLGEKSHKLPVHLHNWDKKFIGMINPCPVKGAHILISLARECPQFEFLVYKSWGFNDDIDRQLKDLQNVTVRSTCKDMEEAWRDIKVLLVPSLWFEAWGIVVTEAHLRGIPVVSSDAGALPEAKLGLKYTIPVNGINGDRNEKGTYIIPAQDIEPWIEPLSELMCEKSLYEEASQKARDTTSQWLKDMDESALENWLLGMVAKSSSHRRDSGMVLENGD